MEKLGIGLFGSNGHQITGLLRNHARAELRAVAAFAPERLDPAWQHDPRISCHETLEQMLENDAVQLISLCSPRRRDQAAQAVRALRAGKHVYAEKPCAMTEQDLDAILKAAAANGRRFHEMAGTALDQPYLAMREVVGAGTVGDVVQVLAQKSYPYHDQRPQDEDTDGGLIAQAAIHAVRFVEHVAGVRIAAVSAVETSLGNPVGGGLRMAAALMFALENGGVGTIVANYLNPKGMGQWGNEHLRVFGTRGFVEAVDGGTRTRLVVGDMDYGELDTSAPRLDYFDLIVDTILDGSPLPFDQDTELHPTRVVIRARNAANLNTRRRA